MRKREQDRVAPGDLRVGPAVQQRPKTGEPREPSGAHARNLQQALGNQAMMRLLQSGAVHTKLDVSQPGDPDEVEADHMADRALSPAIHRKCACEGSGASCPECAEGEVQQAKGIHRKATQSLTANQAARGHFLQSLGPGAPLDPNVRADMEARFGHNFSPVRVHTDQTAAESAQSLSARAYTFDHNIVFNRGTYAPHTADGKRLLAHELSHVVQQSGGTGASVRGGLGLPASRPRKVQRQVTDLILNPGQYAAEKAARWLMNPRNRQFADDLISSVKEAPQHAAEVLLGEVWDAIKEHWISFLAVTIAMMTAETVIGILTGIPEPTLLTKVVAVILQVLVFAIIGYFAAVELVGVYEEGANWFHLAKEANGDPKKITEASKSFLRMIRHIILAILAVAGVRAKIRGGLRIPGAKAPIMEPPPGVKVPPAEPAPPVATPKPPAVEPPAPKPPAPELKAPASKPELPQPKPPVEEVPEPSAPKAETPEPEAPKAEPPEPAPKKPPKEPAPGKRARAAASKEGIRLRKKIAYERMKAGEYDPLQDLLTADERQAFLDSGGKELPKDIDWHHTRQTSADPGMADVPEHIQPLRHAEHIYGEHGGKPANTPTAGIRGDVTSPSKPIFDPNDPEVQTGRYNPNEPTAEGTPEEEGLSDRDLPSRKPGSFRDLPKVKDPALKGKFDYELRTEDGIYRREIATGKWVKFSR